MGGPWDTHDFFELATILIGCWVVTRITVKLRYFWYLRADFGRILFWDILAGAWAVSLPLFYSIAYFTDTYSHLTDSVKYCLSLSAFLFEYLTTERILRYVRDLKDERDELHRSQTQCSS